MKFLGVQEEPKDRGLAFKIACPICGQTRLWHLLEVKISLAVFHWPVLPCKSKRMIVCPGCKHYIDVTAALYRKLQTISSIRTDYFAGKINAEDYRKQMSRHFTPVFNELCAYLKQLAQNSLLPVTNIPASKITENDIIEIFKGRFGCKKNQGIPDCTEGDKAGMALE